MPALPVTPAVSAMEPPANVDDIPKVDLHMHAETMARLDRLVSGRNGAPPHDWAKDVTALAYLPPGMPRLEHAVAGRQRSFDNDRLIALNDDDAVFVQWLTDALFEAATDGAVLVEMRFGGKLRQGFMSLFREAETKVRDIYPSFHAVPLVTGVWPGRGGASAAFASALQAAKDGLGGIDFIPIPYDREADWSEAYIWAQQAADIGLGVTAHAGEFSIANIEAALMLPTVKRIGHGTYAVADPRLIDIVLEKDVTLECCLTSNVLLGAVPSLDDHPIRKLIECGISVTLASDDPLRLCTSIGREYEITARLGIGTEQLMEMSTNGIRASFGSLNSPQSSASVGAGFKPAPSLRITPRESVN